MMHKETEAQILHLLNTQYFICVFVDYYSHNVLNVIISNDVQIKVLWQ